MVIKRNAKPGAMTAVKGIAADSEGDLYKLTF
jgi:hypothetical protein